MFENRRLLQDRGILSRIFETAATARRQVGVMLVHVGYMLLEILQMCTMHNLPHRAQVMTIFQNEIPLKIR